MFVVQFIWVATQSRYWAVLKEIIKTKAGT